MLGSTAKSNAYTMTISMLTAITGLVIDPKGYTLSLIGTLSGVLFLLMWGWLCYEVGLNPVRSSAIAILVYWVILPIAILALDLTAQAGVSAQPLVLLYEALNALVFSANYLLVWVCRRFSFSIWGSVLGGWCLLLLGWYRGYANRIRQE